MGFVELQSVPVLMIKRAMNCVLFMKRFLIISLTVMGVVARFAWNVRASRTASELDVLEVFVLFLIWAF